MSTIFAIIGVQAQMFHDFPTDESVAAATDKVVPPAITRKLLLICLSSSTARPAVKIPSYYNALSADAHAS